MALRERERELDHGVADGEARDPVLAGDVRRVEPAEDDVVAAEMWLERVARAPARRQCPPAGSDSIASALASATRSTRAEELEMLRADVGHDDEARLRDRAERCDLAEPAHPHLGDQDLRLGLEPADRERQADLVVQAPLGPDRRHVRRAERTEDVLRRRLPGRPDHRDDLRVAALAGRAARSRRVRASWSSGTSVIAPRARASSTNRTPVFRATKRSPRPTSRESALTAVIESPGSPPSSTPRAEPRDLLEPNRDHVAPRRRLARDLAVVERGHDAVDVLALLVSLARDHDDVTRLRRARSRGRSRSADPGRSRRPCRSPAGRPR